MVRARHDEVNGGPVREEIVQTQLGAGSRCTVPDDDPVVLRGGVTWRGVCFVPGAVGPEGVWVDEVCCEGSLDQVGFADP